MPYGRCLVCAFCTLLLVGTAGCGPSESDGGGGESDTGIAEDGDDGPRDTGPAGDTEPADTSKPDPDSGSDTVADADTGGEDAVDFEYPNGKPDPDTLHLKGECTSGGLCENNEEFGTWHEAAVTNCSFDGSVFTVEASTISGGNSSFTLSFAAPSSPQVSLGGDDTTVDWTLSDGGSAFLFFDGEQQPVDSTGTVELEECGSTVAGRFDVQDVCEYHSCSTNQASLTGAFHCSPSQSMSCGKD